MQIEKKIKCSGSANQFIQSFSSNLLVLGPVVLSVACLTAYPGVKFESQLGCMIFMESYHEIIFMVILSFPMIQKGQLSATGESICTSTD